MFRRSCSLFLVLALGLIGLFIASCSSSLSPGRPSPILQDDEIGGYIGGKTGLAISLMDGAPPDVIQDMSLTPFSFIVQLENMGEADVGSGTDNPLVFVRLAGIMYRNFHIKEPPFAGNPAPYPDSTNPDEPIKKLEDTLHAAKRNFDDTILPGEIGYVSFDNLKYMPNIYESMALTIRAEICYDYETHATTKICVKRDVLETWEDASICTLRGFKPVGNSGGPIHVTSVEETPVNDNTVQLNIKLEHVGNGVFFYRGEDNDLWGVCDFRDTNPEIYKLEMFVEPVQKDTYEIDCLSLDNTLPSGGAHGVVRMYRGAPITISCFLKRVAPMKTRIYEDLVDVKLIYRYGDFIEKPILIQGHP